MKNSTSTWTRISSQTWIRNLKYSRPVPRTVLINFKLNSKIKFQYGLGIFRIEYSDSISKYLYTVAPSQSVDEWYSLFIFKVHISCCTKNFSLFMEYLDIANAEVASTTFQPVHKTFFGVKGRWEYGRPTTAIVLEGKQPVIESSPSLKPIMAGIHVFISKLFTSCRIFIFFLVFLDMEKSKATPLREIFSPYSLPPVQATSNGVMGRWAYRGPKTYVFIQDKQAVCKWNRSYMISGKRKANNVINPV